METVTILIKASGPTPNPAYVKPGYQVIFQMDEWTDEVTVDFGTNSPFVSQVTQFSLNGAVLTLSHKTYTIADNASPKYTFHIIPATRIDPEPPSIPPGDLEVTREEPPKDEK
jgi:hypothetical protein